MKIKYNPSLMMNSKISETINEDKFSFTHDNITKLISFHNKKDKNTEISTNTRYIESSKLDKNYNNIFKLTMIYYYKNNPF